MQRTTTSIATHANLPIMPSTTREWKRLCFPGWCGENWTITNFEKSSRCVINEPCLNLSAVSTRHRASGPKMPQALRARTVSEDTWRMPVTRLTRGTHLAGHGWRVGNGKQSTANQATESIASTHDDVNLTRLTRTCRCIAVHGVSGRQLEEFEVWRVNCRDISHIGHID